MDAMTPEPTQPAAPPPLADWWGHTGLLYVGASAVAAVLGSVVMRLIWFGRAQPTGMPPLAEIAMYSVQGSCIAGALIGIAQWFVLRRLVRRALLAATGQAISQPGLRLVRDTALWIAATVAGTAAGGAFIGVLIGFLFRQGSLELFLPINGVCVLAYGFVLGTAQLLVLRRYIPEPLHWTRWTIAGLLLGAVFNNTVENVMPIIATGSNPAFASVLMIVISAVNEAAIFVFVAAFQVRCLKRVAPLWIKRLHERAQKAPADGA